MTRYILRRPATVSPDPGRHQSGVPVELAAGTPLDDIIDTELAQLSPEHFTAVGADEGTGKLPDDWRTNRATLAHDRRQNKANREETKARNQWKAG
jgi:hypothetical protein